MNDAALKKLAEAAAAEMPEHCYDDETICPRCTWFDDRDAYRLAATPQVVLALLQRIERLKTALQSLLNTPATMGVGDIDIIIKAIEADDAAQTEGTK